MSSGILTSNVAPPAELFLALMLPLWLSTIVLAIDKPMPIPSLRVERIKDLLNSLRTKTGPGVGDLDDQPEALDLMGTVDRPASRLVAQ